MSAITPYDWAIIAFVIGVTFLCVFMLTVPLLLGGKSWGRAKQEQFESGVVSAGGARIRLSAKFYLVAIFFVVFDLEALYLYAWASSVREVGWIGFATAAVFILVLLLIHNLERINHTHLFEGFTKIQSMNISLQDRERSEGIKRSADANHEHYRYVTLITSK